MKLDEKDIAVIEKATEITLTDYEIKKIDNEGYIDPNNLVSAIDDLCMEVDYLEEKIRDVKNALHREGLDYLGW